MADIEKSFQIIKRIECWKEVYDWFTAYNMGKVVHFNWAQCYQSIHLDNVRN